MPRTRMALKRPASEPLPAPEESEILELSSAAAASAAPVATSSSDLSDDAELTPAEANADEFSEDDGSSDADVPSSLQSAAADCKTASVITEPLKRDHR